MQLGQENTSSHRNPNRWMLPPEFFSLGSSLLHRMVLMRAFNKASWMGSWVSDASAFLRPMAALAYPKGPKSFANTILQAVSLQTT